MNTEVVCQRMLELHNKLINNQYEKPIYDIVNTGILSILNSIEDMEVQ